MCKEMPAIPVERVVDNKRVIRTNGGPRRRRGTRGRWPPKRPIGKNSPNLVTRSLFHRREREKERARERERERERKRKKVENNAENLVPKQLQRSCYNFDFESCELIKAGFH
jgi:hypothetical protein